MTGDTQKVVEVYGFEAIHLQIDDVYFFRRIAEDFLGIDINAQTGLSGSQQHRIIVAETIHRSRTQSGDKTNEAVLTAYAGRPAEFIVAEGDTREGRKKIFADLVLKKKNAPFNRILLFVALNTC